MKCLSIVLFFFLLNNIVSAQNDPQQRAFLEYIDNGGKASEWTTQQNQYTKQYINNNYKLNNSGTLEIKKTYKSGTISSSTGMIMGKFENNQVLNGLSKPLGYYSNGWFYNYSNQCIGGISGTNIVNCQGSTIAMVSNNTVYDGFGYVIGYLNGDNLYSASGSLIVTISAVSMQNLSAYLLFLN
jgi:hypothetical protein